MALSLEYFDAAGNAVADGVFIPVAALPGVLAAELAAAQSTALKEGKALLGLLNQMFNVISLAGFSKLGFAITKGIPAGVSADVANVTFSTTWQKLANLDNDTIGAIPVPTVGTSLGLGDFSVEEIFPGAAKVAAGGAVAGAGIVVTTAALTAYSSLTHGGLNTAAWQDNWAWFAALTDHLAAGVTVRDTANSIASAVTAVTLGTVDAATIPDAFIAAANPTSGILVADVPSRGLVTRTNSYTVQLELNQTTQTFDVRVA